MNRAGLSNFTLIPKFMFSVIIIITIPTDYFLRKFQYGIDRYYFNESNLEIYKTSSSDQFSGKNFLYQKETSANLRKRHKLRNA